MTEAKSGIPSKRPTSPRHKPCKDGRRNNGANFKGDSKSRAGGRPKGCKNKSTVRRDNAMEQMAEMGFNPLEMAVLVAKGEALRKDVHPFLSILKQYIKNIRELNDSQERGIPAQCDRLWVEACDSLNEAHTPIEIRSRHMLDLISYVHPKLKSTELSINPIHATIAVTPLTKAEAEKFSRWFKTEY